MPIVEPGVPSDQWQLGDEGRAGARSLRSQLSEPAYFVASDEPKAIQTLKELAGETSVSIDPGFREVRRPYTWSDEYRMVARDYVDGIRPREWEDHVQVADRFATAVARHAAIAVALGRALVIGTHGLAPTVWLITVMRLDPSPAQFWERLSFPDLIDVDLLHGTASRRCTR
jgi:broad specificity phosphatase PhoE